jgi:hypothetical protein
VIGVTEPTFSLRVRAQWSRGHVFQVSVFSIVLGLFCGKSAGLIMIKVDITCPE